MPTVLHFVVLFLGLLAAWASLFTYGGFPACRDGFQEFVCTLATVFLGVVGIALVGLSLHFMGKDDWITAACSAYALVYSVGFVRTLRQIP
jgi:hypothetical protein